MKKRTSLRCEHWTKEWPFVLRPIVIGQKKNGLLIKPAGGLWLSPVASSYAWRHWCEAEMPEWIAGKHRVEMLVRREKLLVIDGEKDLARLPWEPYVSTIEQINFAALLVQGFEGVHLTVQGQKATRLSYPRSLYGWDCETVLILDHRAILQVLEPA